MRQRKELYLYDYKGDIALYIFSYIVETEKIGGFLTVSRYNRFRRSGPTRVTIAWQQTSQLYAFKFSDMYHKDECGMILQMLKSIPHGSEREYDPETYTWYFVEKYFEPIKQAIEAFGPSVFTLDVVEKPEPQMASGSKIPDISIMKDKFAALTGVHPDAADFKAAKKAYFKTSMILHPDKFDEIAQLAGYIPTDFYKLNEAWQELEFQYYKTKKRVVELKNEEEGALTI